MSGGECSLDARSSSRVAAAFVKSDHGTPLFKTPHFCLSQGPSMLSVTCKRLRHSGGCFYNLSSYISPGSSTSSL